MQRADLASDRKNCRFRNANVHMEDQTSSVSLHFLRHSQNIRDTFTIFTIAKKHTTGGKMILISRIGISLACLVAATFSTGTELTLRMGTPFVSGSNLHKGMLKFAEVIEKESQGKIKIQVYTDSQIGDILQLISGMQLGSVDMAYLGVANAGQVKGGAPLNISYVPYLYKSKAKATEIMNGPIFQEMYEGLAKRSGLRIFAVAGARSPRAIVTTKGPIKTPADLKGIRLRIPPIDMFRAMFEQLGVKAVPLGLNEV
jgi:TRAP-type transport system periplasmic protein